MKKYLKPLAFIAAGMLIAAFSGYPKVGKLAAPVA